MNVPLVWNTYVEEFNAKRMEVHNVFEHYGVMDDLRKAAKKYKDDKDSFAEQLRRTLMYHYWSKCEWELIIEFDENEHIWLNPWVGCREPENVRIDVTDDKSFDWHGFIETQRLRNNCEKIDVYDMLKYRWDDFITYLWTTRQKYERRHPKFDK